MSEIVTDLGVNKPWRAYKHGDNLWNAALGIDLTTYVFTLDIYSNSNTLGTPKLSLTEGAGITNNGASGVLNILLTKAQAEALKGNDFFYVLKYTVDGTTQRKYQGALTLQTGNNPASSLFETSAEVMLGGTGVVDIDTFISSMTVSQRQALAALLDDYIV